MRHRSAASSLEALESRIAPAVLTVGAVTINTSKGTLADLTAAAVFDTAGDGHLISLTLASKFKGSDVSVTTTAGPGLAAVGLIEAAGIDLGRVIIDGELGQINAGDLVASTPALAKLEVKALGTTLTTQAPGGDVDSHINGRITALLVHGNIAGTLNVEGPNGSIGTATIDGSLAGGAAGNSGSIFTTRAIGRVTIGGDIAGGDGDLSGLLQAGGAITRLEISGNISGGKGSNSGSVSVFGDLQFGTVDGAITGGLDATGGANSGRILVAGNIGTLNVTGKLQGGNTLNSGTITAGDAGIDSVTVNGGLVGGDAKDTGTIATSGVLRKAVIGSDTQGMAGGKGEHSGSLLSSTRIASVIVNGSILGGDGLTSGVIASDGTMGTVVVHGSVVGGNLDDQSGAIGSAKAMTKVVIDGDLKGGTAAKSGQVVSIATIGSVAIGGSVIGGDGPESGALGALGSIGTITIAGQLKGGSAFHSGTVLLGGSLTKMTVDAVQGGAGPSSGKVGVGGNLSSLTVAHDITGGLGDFSATVVVNGTTKSVLVGGSLVANPGDAASEKEPPSGTASIACFGPILFVDVEGDLRGQGNRSGSVYSSGQITKVLVHGSLVGGPQSFSGSIFTQATDAGSAGIGTVVIDGNMIGGGSQMTGSVRSANSIGSVTVGLSGEPSSGIQVGQVIGGGGIFSAAIYARTDIGSVKIGGSLQGMADASALISAGGNLGSVLVKGNVTGGAASYDLDDRLGQIAAVKTIGSVTVENSVIGGSGGYSSTIVGGSVGSVSITRSLRGGTGSASGSILAVTGDITSVNVGGSITNIALPEPGPVITGTTPASGSISATRYLGSVTVGGEILGEPGSPVVISAGGQLNPTTDAQAQAIRLIKVDGAMSFTQVLAGYDVKGNPVNGDVQINTIDVGGGALDVASVWRENDIVAGFRSSKPTFGDGDDLLISNGTETKLISKILKVIVRGNIAGTGDSHGIVAEQVNSIVVNAVAEPLQAGPMNDFFSLQADPSRGTSVFEGVTPRAV